MNQNDFLAYTSKKVVYTSDLASFWRTSGNFPTFQRSLKFAFLVQDFPKFFFVLFLFDVIKRNSSHIYWVPDLQPLKLVCFMVANTWKRKYAYSRVFLFFFLIDLIEDDDLCKHFKINTG